MNPFTKLISRVAGPVLKSTLSSLMSDFLRGGSGTATDTLNWTASGITLVQNRVNDITVTVSCTGGVPGASDLISVRANGIGRAVLLMPMNENKGTAVGDISGLNNDGTFMGSGNSWVAGKFGLAVQMNGSGWIQVPDADTLDLSVFTLSAWLYPTDLSRYKPLFKQGQPSTIRSLCISGGVRELIRNVSRARQQNIVRCGAEPEHVGLFDAHLRRLDAANI